MHVLHTPLEDPAKEKVMECACGRKAPEQSPTREERPGQEQDVFHSPEIYEWSYMKKE
jgi:hypothetical protein